MINAGIKQQVVSNAECWMRIILMPSNLLHCSVRFTMQNLTPAASLPIPLSYFVIVIHTASEWKRNVHYLMEGNSNTCICAVRYYFLVAVNNGRLTIIALNKESQICLKAYFLYNLHLSIHLFIIPLSIHDYPCRTTMAPVPVSICHWTRSGVFSGSMKMQLCECSFRNAFWKDLLF